MSHEYVIGLDLGTTSAKAVIFTLNGKVVAEAEDLVTSYYPKQGWVEQDPDEIERSAVKAINMAIQQAKVNKEDIISLGISAAMHSIICMADNGEALSQALIWADGRSTKQANELMESDGLEIFSRTGMPIHPMSPLAKLIWMKEIEYIPYTQSSYFLSIKEYLLLKWFNQRVIDYSMASATGMFNGKTFQWDPEVLSKAGITEEMLSKIVPPTYRLTDINPKIADEMGISSEMPFIIGAADGQFANLGIGAISPGEVAVTAGTSGAIRQFTKGFQSNTKHETFCYAFTDEHFIVGGPTNNGGIALQWLKELLNYQESFDHFTAEAKKVGPGAEGLFFHPYINGERAPLWNQQARGNFFGMSVTHKTEHFVRAVLEGITFNLYQIGQALEKQAGETEKLYVNGGLARSPLWLQMLADVFGKEVYVPETHHSAAWGAAWTALVGIGKVNSFEEIKNNIPMGEPVVPNQENHEKYKAIYAKYEAIGKDIIKHF
ncbi:gluconokinase [Fredinandcohnia sp. QZ13]|uniref:gluconokinase n=1 Tax=Fredinandcohnia sp. QZ13 TaxID=3073144 RepID=UPI0028532BB2|nr:gluconokinase [Fredinandcohnia sp. QZ13]MDR4886334.1 gluconokinase [Fredinandcohnia sp. QZ13]